MGRVPNTGQGKAFEGTPSSIDDKKSIQKAIKGTISDETLATKNLATLAGLARLDMFYPPRDNNPVDCNQFRNYPLPTIIFTTINSSKTGSSGNWDVDVSFGLSVNHFVGFNAKIEVRCTVNLDASQEQLQTRFIVAKEKDLRSVSYTGLVDSTFSFSFTGVGNSTGGGDNVDVTIDALYIPDDVNIGSALSPSGGGSAYYDPDHLITFDAGDTMDDNPYSWQTYEVDSVDDCTYSTVGTEFLSYTRQETLSIGMKVYDSSNGDTTISQTKVRMFTGSGDYYLCQLNISREIVSIVECDSGIA